MWMPMLVEALHEVDRVPCSGRNLAVEARFTRHRNGPSSAHARAARSRTSVFEPPCQMLPG